MSPLRHGALVLLLGAIALLGGCSSHAPPKLTVTDAALTGESPTGYVITFRLAAENSNRDQLPLRKISYTLWINEHQVFSGSRSPEATLARLAIQELRLPAAAPIDAEHPRPVGIVSYRISGTLTYVTTSQLMEVLYDSGLPPPTAPFSHDGTIDLGPLGSGPSP